MYKNYEQIFGKHRLKIQEKHCKKLLYSDKKNISANIGNFSMKYSYRNLDFYFDLNFHNTNIMIFVSVSSPGGYTVTRMVPFDVRTIFPGKNRLAIKDDSYNHVLKCDGRQRRTTPLDKDSFKNYTYRIYLCIFPPSFLQF